MGWVEATVVGEGKNCLDSRFWVFFVDCINFLWRWDHEYQISSKRGWNWRRRCVVDNKVVIFIRWYILDIFCEVYNWSLLDNFTSFEILKSYEGGFVIKLIVESINSFIPEELDKISHKLFLLKIFNILRTEINAFSDRFLIQNSEIFIFILHCF